MLQRNKAAQSLDPRRARLASELGFTRVRDSKLAEVEYIRLRLVQPSWIEAPHVIWKTVSPSFDPHSSRAHGRRRGPDGHCDAFAHGTGPGVSDGEDQHDRAGGN